MTIYYGYEFDEPNPFIFCSFDLIAQLNGGNADWYDGSGDCEETPGYPVSNCIDGNRQSFFELTGIGPFKSGMGRIRTDYLNNNDRQAHLICIESDPKYPIHSVRMRKYAGGWGGSDEWVEISKPNEYDVVNYIWGVPPRVDGEALGDRDPTFKEVGGIDGRYFNAFFEDEIPSDSPYIELWFPQCGRNHYGIDGSFDNGVWWSGVDETIETSDPCPDSTGQNDNYMELVATASSGIKTSNIGKSNLRQDCEYMFGCYLKTLVAAGDGGEYRVKVAYSDREGAYISSGVLWSSTSVNAWSNKIMIPCNYIKRNDGKRYSGLSGDEHLVPDGTFEMGIWWEIDSDGTDTLTMRVDDAALYDMSIPFRPEDYTIRTYDSYVYRFPEVLDVSGTIRVNRVSLYEYITSTSKGEGRKSNWINLGNKPLTNPSQTDYSIKGKTTVEDFYGNIAAQFIPRAGVKRLRNFTWVVDKHGANFLSDIASSGEPMGIIDPDGDWGDFVILNGFKVTSLVTPTPRRRYPYKEIISPNDLYQAIVPVSEV